MAATSPSTPNWAWIGDGRFLALKVDFTVNVGCYLSGRSLFLLNNIGGIAGVYRIANIEASITGVFTNTMTNAPYRGAGRPEATYVIERLIDIAARDLGLDPFELRLRNLVPPSAMPYDTGFLFKYDCGEFEGNMTGVAKLADRAGFAARKEAVRETGHAARARYGEPDRGGRRPLHQAAQGSRQAQGPCRRHGDALCRARCPPDRASRRR